MAVGSRLEGRVPRIFSEEENSTLPCATVEPVRIVVAVAAALLTAGLTAAPLAVADPTDPAPADDPTSCNVPACVPGIQPGAVLGAPCNNPTYYSFGVTDWGRVVFCGSPRRYEPRWFRTTAVLGVNPVLRRAERAQHLDARRYLTTTVGPPLWLKAVAD
jgi:hypothetical protein